MTQKTNHRKQGSFVIVGRGVDDGEIAKENALIHASRQFGNETVRNVSFSGRLVRSLAETTG